jgi:death-on-curing protein
MSANWRWITKQALLLLHGESLAEHGGGEGIRDEGRLDSALARPLNVVAYADPAAPPDIATLAASYGFGIWRKTPPFVGGNKRVAFVAVGLFLACQRASPADQAGRLCHAHHARRRRR